MSFKVIYLVYIPVTVTLMCIKTMPTITHFKCFKKWFTVPKHFIYLNLTLVSSKSVHIVPAILF